jgi:hypothetical protein
VFPELADPVPQPVRVADVPLVPGELVEAPGELPVHDPERRPVGEGVDQAGERTE